MLRFLLLTPVFLLLFVSAQAQTLVGISGSTLSVSPSNTVTNGTTVTVTGSVVNAGTTTITGALHVNLAIDTSSTSTPKYALHSTATYSVFNFAPAATQTFVLTDVVSNTNQYRVTGNGTTVIVWPVSGVITNTITTKDSARTIIYISPTGANSIKEFEASPIYLKNPVSETIILNYDHSVYDRVELINMNGEIVLNAITDTTLLVSNCSKGLYFLRFYNKNKIGSVTKKVLIE